MYRYILRARAPEFPFFLSSFRVIRFDSQDLLAPLVVNEAPGARQQPRARDKCRRPRQCTLSFSDLFALLVFRTAHAWALSGGAGEVPE